MVINHCPVMLSLPKHLCVATALLLVLATASAQEFANIEYLCADWGPAMKLPTKEGEKPQFSDTEEEIYFLKQVGRFTRKKSVPDLFSGKTTRDVGRGISIYLCKMKPDGSQKTEIKELWRNPNHAIDTQGQSTWMDVNEKTRKIALSIRYAGSDTLGLWTMNLDGNGLKRIVPPSSEDVRGIRVNHPSWTPDGKWIVFDQEGGGQRIMKCDAEGSILTNLSDGPHDDVPCVSPDGKHVLYIHWIRKGDVNDSWLWLMDVDGGNKRPVANPNAKPFWSAQAHWGTYPAWSPDGKRIFFLGVTSMIVDVETGKELVTGALHQGGIGWPQWGKHGLITLRVCGIALGDLSTKTSRVLAACTTTECKPGDAPQCRW
jgi:Tol biopolymer transport system component